MTRAELIGGILATSALAACGGGAATPSTTKTAAEQCAAAAFETVGVNQIFSDPAFSALDKQTLIDMFETSAAQALQPVEGYFGLAGRQPQTTYLIQSIPGGGIVIEKPGKYTFAGNIQWTPGTDQSCAIWIACSDVTLDLSGYTLSASVANTAWRTTGIVAGTAATQTTNISVTNGTLASFTEHGLLANSVCNLNLSRVTVTGLCLNNLQIRFLTPAGIKALNSENVAIWDSTVTNSNVTADSSAGIFLQNIIGGSVTNCTASTLLNNDGAVQGFGYIRCMYVTTASCTAKSLQTQFNGNLLTSGHTVLGFCPILCWDLTYTDCSASQLIGSCDDCHGMSVFLDGNVTVTRFQADTVVDGTPPTYTHGAKATGLEVYGVGVTVVDCTVSNITAYNPEDLQATGFSAWGLAISFTNCTANNVTATGTGALGMGFGWAPDPRKPFNFPAIGVAYVDCTANSCQVGFDTWYHVNSIWIHPAYSNIQVSGILQPGPTATRTLTCDGCSECPTGGPLTPPGGSVTLTNKASGNTIVP